MTALEKLIKDRVDRLDSVPESLQSVVQKQEHKLLNKALDSLAGFEVDENGKIITSKSNLARIERLLDDLSNVLYGGDYGKAVQEFSGEIAKQAELNNSIFEYTIGKLSDASLSADIVKLSQQNALALLDKNATTQQLINPLRQIMQDATISSVKIADAVKTLTNSLTGDGALLSKYVKQYIGDAFSVADRRYVSVTSERMGIEFYRYSGGKVSETREFCLERYNQYFHKDEIAAWGEFKNTDPGKFERPKYLGEVKGHKIYWEGMNYNTNSGTIFSYCGGYGCRHVFVPLATKYVPKEAIARAVNLGYYKEV